MIRTYKYKLYNNKKLNHIHRTINIAGIIYNHCIALHKRYYKLYGKSLNKFQLPSNRMQQAFLQAMNCLLHSDRRLVKKTSYKVEKKR